MLIIFRHSQTGSTSTFSSTNASQINLRYVLIHQRRHFLSFVPRNLTWQKHRLRLSWWWLQVSIRWRSQYLLTLNRKHTVILLIGPIVVQQYLINKNNKHISGMNKHMRTAHHLYHTIWQIPVLYFMVIGKTLSLIITI